MRGAALLAALVAAGMTGAGEAAADSVDAGSLRARTTAEPWSLAFTDPGGAAVLSEYPGTGLGPSGTVGFSTPAGWFHATRVTEQHREGAAYVARLATTDPLGRSVDLRIEPAGEGVIRVHAAVSGVATADVTATGIGFGARRDERYVGFGERSNAVDQRGNTVEDYVAEGPYQPEERPLIATFVPLAGYHPRDDATYFPMPWLLSSAGYGVLVDDLQTGYFRLASDRADAWSAEVDAPAITFRVFAGPRPGDVLRRLTERVGRQPRVDAYHFGPWYQPRRGDAFAELDKMLQADVPLTLAQTYTHYLPCGDQRGREGAERDQTRRFHEAGLAVTTYFNPMLCQSYEPVFSEAASRGALTKTQTGDPYLYRYTGSSVFLVGQFDFSSPAGREIYGRLLREALSNGYDGWMEDFGEYTPADSKSSNGMDGTTMHNLYPVQYHCTAQGAVTGRTPATARFIRSGWTGVAPCAQAVWGGDPTTGWGFDGLQSAVRNGLTLGLSGISRWGSDIGGFFSLGDNKLTPELLVRWIEFGAVSGVMRTQANGFALPDKARPQLSDPEVLPYWRRWARFRTRLYPYVAAADDAYRASGLPAMRHLMLAYPDDPRAAGSDDEFMFGPDLLAAPVLEPGARRRSLYLPRGLWVDLWRTLRFTEDGRTVLGGPRLLEGGRGIELPAPLGELPLLARAGALIPLLPASVDTLSPYGGGRQQVRLADRSRELELLAFPRGRSAAPLPAGGRVTAREARGRVGFGLLQPGRRTYALRASLATLKHPFRPCRVIVGKRRLSRRSWRYDRSARMVAARFRLRRPGRVTITRSCASARRPARRRPARHRRRRPAYTG